MSRKNKAIIWLAFTIVLIIVFTVLATYAYFNARENYYGGFEVDVTSKGVDTLAFTGSEDAVISANVNNFAPGIGRDVTGSAEIEVKLDTTQAETAYCYEMYLHLPDTKVFSYSNGNVPELLLNVKRSEDGQNYQNVISNLDITEKTGTISIPITEGSQDYLNEIYTKKNIQKVQYWKADITLVWFESVDQTVNDNKSYSATLEAKRVDCK